MLALIRRFKAWRQRQAQWHAEHVASFAAVAHRLPDGLTAFQHECVAALENFIPRDSYRRVAGTSGYGQGDYLVAPLDTQGGEVYIYENDAGYGNSRNSKDWTSLEEWAFRTPGELIEYLKKECASRAAEQPHAPRRDG
jgi:hypothetical protein